MRFEVLHPREQLVQIMHRVYHGGMTTLSGGNLSIREANGDIWITPSGIDKGKLMPQDIMCVRADGKVEGAHKPSSEFPFHRAIYAHRPDLNAIVHAHPPALVAFSIARQIPSTSIIPQAQHICGAVGYAPYALPGSEQLGARIAETFAQGYNVVLLENHGVATGGSDLLAAFQRLETLDFCARAQIRAQKLGTLNELTGDDLRLFATHYVDLPEVAHTTYSSHERELRQHIVEVVHRAYERHLMISTEGVVSARLEGDCFLITPTRFDRRSIEIEDVVFINDNQRERGKQPSRSVRLHNAIYRTHPAVQSIMIAQAPAITAYAIAASHFDTRTIPESYILLRDIPLMPYGAQYRQPERVADLVSLRSPVLLLQNDCVMTVGRSILEAFDRLEVAEYSAQSLLDTMAIGPLVPIGQAEIHDLERAFALSG
jgi:L-fuculose-phosphate aldolase